MRTGGEPDRDAAPDTTATPPAGDVAAHAADVPDPDPVVDTAAGLDTAATRDGASAPGVDVVLVAEIGIVVWFTILAWRLQWIADDGYIYLTYVDNWVDGGIGPNFASGERVEAYTSTLWFLLLSAGDLVRPDRLVSLEQMTVLAGLACSIVAAACWIPIERAATRLAGPGRRPTIVNVPLALFASGYVFRVFATSGMETPLIMCWIVAVAWLVWQPDPNPYVLAALAGLGPLVRPDLVLVSFGLGVFAVAAARWGPCRELPSGRRATATLAGLALGPVVVTESIRIGYYGQLVANTYYAKTDTGHGWGDGWRYLLDTARPHRLVWIGIVAVLVVAVPAVARARAGRGVALGPVGWRRAWFLVMAAVSALGTIAVGGDFMHARTLIPAWMLLLASLSGATTFGVAWVDARRPIAPLGRAAAAVALVLVVMAVQLPTTSRQHATGELIIDGIADEMRFYERRNPAIHEFGGTNHDPLAAQGRDLRELARRLDTEIGMAAGAIGQRSYFGMLGDGDVYIYDVHGLTRLDVARVEPSVAGTRVGHSHRAPAPLVVANRRVDVVEPETLSFEGYDDAFTIEIGTSSFVLVDFDLIDPLVREGLLGATDVERMEDYLLARLDAAEPDADLVTLLTWRYHRGGPVGARVDELADLARNSPWTEWVERTADARAELGVDGCSTNWFGCVRTAIERHTAGPIPYLEPDPSS